MNILQLRLSFERSCVTKIVKLVLGCNSWISFQRTRAEVGMEQARC